VNRKVVSGFSRLLRDFLSCETLEELLKVRV
jgi:hypothetical protein